MTEAIHDPFIEILKRSKLFEQVPYTHPLVNLYTKLTENAKELDQAGLSLEQRAAIGRLVGTIALIMSGRTSVAKGYQQAIRKSFARRQRSKLSDKCCFYCGGPDESVDHLTPISRGGTNDPPNLVPSCIACNTMKADMTADEFIGHVRRIVANLKD